MADHNAKIARCPLPVARCPLPVARCHNYALDFLKGIGCIGVVFIHIKFPGFFGDFVHRSAQFAVPIFFMISGFYAYQSDDSTLIRRLRRIFRITLFTVLIYYILFRLPNMNVNDELFTFENMSRALIKLVIFSSFGFDEATHLWFLFSLIEGYIILLVVKRFNLWKAGYVYILLSFVLSRAFVVFGLLPDENFPGFLVALRWFFMGHYVAKNKAFFSKVSRNIFIVSAIAGYLAGLLRLTGHMILIARMSFNLFYVSLFILAVREDSQAVKFPQPIVKIGAEYSLYVYLFHILVDRIYSSVLKLAGVYYNPFALWTRPLVVVVLSLALSFVIVKVRDKISRKKSE